MKGVPLSVQVEVLTLPLGELEANCHIVYDEEGNAVVIDPGAEADRLLKVLEKKAWKVHAILLTHAHFDHFGAASAVMDALQIPIYLHLQDEPLLHSIQLSLADYLGRVVEYQNIVVCNTVQEGDVLKFSDALEFTVLHTPGHSPGSVCYMLGDKLFTGDTLFRDAVGRVDFQGGNLKDMRTSLQRLGALEGDYKIYCGHYAGTTLAREKAYSHYLKPATPRK